MSERPEFVIHSSDFLPWAPNDFRPLSRPRLLSVIDYQEFSMLCLIAELFE
jgi:hypothetical protein